MERFAEQLIAHRKAKGLTQSQLAERLHVTRSTISHWENGRYVPSAGMMRKISEILDCEFQPGEDAEAFDGEKQTKVSDVVENDGTEQTEVCYNCEEHFQEPTEVCSEDVEPHANPKGHFPLRRIALMIAAAALATVAVWGFATLTFSPKAPADAAVNEAASTSDEVWADVAYYQNADEDARGTHLAYTFSAEIRGDANDYLFCEIDATVEGAREINVSALEIVQFECTGNAVRVICNGDDGVTGRRFVEGETFKINDCFPAGLFRGSGINVRGYDGEGNPFSCRTYIDYTALNESYARRIDDSEAE